MIGLIRQEFEGSPAHKEFQDYLENEQGHSYQNAFEFLHGRRGPDAANKIVRSAVCKALNVSDRPHSAPNTTLEKPNPTVFSALEQQPHAWFLPKAVDMFGQLLVACTDPFGKVVLTTNFDPLIEISILKHGGRFYRTTLHDDGNLGQTIAEGTHVVHLHGYWYGADTLHTPQQLTHPRPHLIRSLSELVAESILVVVGYSGWDDIITTTLIELLSTSGSYPEIMWGFYQNDEFAIESSNTRLLATLAPGIGRGRVSLYRGIDCCDLFSKVYDRLRASYSVGTAPLVGPRTTTTVKEEPSDAFGQGQLHIQIHIPMPKDMAQLVNRKPFTAAVWQARSVPGGTSSSCPDSGWRSSFNLL